MNEPDFPAAVKGVAFLALSKTVHPEAREALEAMRAEVWARNFEPSPGRLDAGDRIREVPPLPLS